MDAYVEDRLQWRMVGPAEKHAVTELRRQIEAFDDTMIPAVERLLGFEEPELDGNCVGGWDNYGSLMAYGWNIVDPDPHTARVTLTGGVHPTHRFLSIGRRLLAWQENRAREWRDEERPGMDLELTCYVEAVQPGLHHVLQNAGFHDERHFIDMHRALDNLPPPREVAGCSFVGFHHDFSEAVHDLHHVCFGAAVDADHGDWNTSLTGVRPEWSWLALEDDAVVGYILSGEDDAAALDGVVEGWTGRLGVHPDHRRRGIATALLGRTLASMAEAGCLGAGIGVDSADADVPRTMLEDLGYEVRDSVLLMRRRIPAVESVS